MSESIDSGVTVSDKEKAAIYHYEIRNYLFENI
jgi:hypothetical protein